MSVDTVVLDSAYLWHVSIHLGSAVTSFVPSTRLRPRWWRAKWAHPPIEWRLLTNRPVLTQQQAVELIDWYRARWEIETSFHVLENGCEVEALQLATIERLERALALFMVVAWRVTYLMRKGRTCPDMDRVLPDPNLF